MLEEEFKNDPPKKAPRKTKEHIYEEIEAPPLKQLAAKRLGKPGRNFANAVLHSVLNKDEFKGSLQKQHEIEEVEESKVNSQLELNEPTKFEDKTNIDNDIDKPTLDEAITSESIDVNVENKGIPVEDSSTMENKTNIEITIDHADDLNAEKKEKTDDDTKAKSDARKEVLTKDEKKVKFSQSTEERYQEKLAAEKGHDKEDVELPEHIKVAKRWSNMRFVFIYLCFIDFAF